jgi:hypothetical protein
MAKSRIDNHLTSLSRQAAKLEGMRDLLIDQLSEEFSCNTLEEAKSLLKHRRKEKEVMDADLKKGTATFMEQWGEFLKD